MQLTEDHFKAMEAVRNGAEVFGYTTAQALRQVERNAPHLVHITPPMGNYKPYEQHPYFGAILTAAGKEYLDNLPAPTPTNQEED